MLKTLKQQLYRHCMAYLEFGKDLKMSLKDKKQDKHIELKEFWIHRNYKWNIDFLENREALLIAWTLFKVYVFKI